MHTPEQFRIRDKKLPGSMEAEGNNGLFVIPHYKIVDAFFLCWATVETGWNHISVTVNRKGKTTERACNQEEMDFIKDKFWKTDEVVLQFYYTKDGYINVNPRCRHLYQFTGGMIPVPPSLTEGIV